jgi:DNA gyrase subunit A
MVRMAQPWSMRVPLIEGQGNFGSMDNDPAAAMRYTEARMYGDRRAMLQRHREEHGRLRVPNYDGKEMEPTVLPSAFPQPARQRFGRHRGRHGHQDPPHNLGGVHRRAGDADRQARRRRSRT